MLKKIFYWITNNNKTSEGEIEFDIFFFLVNTLALILGVIWLIQVKEYAWISFIIIEYNWAWDNMRNNRLH